jgi:hypothetical protein
MLSRACAFVLSCQARPGDTGVPIYRLLQNSAFEPEHVQAMEQAFEETLAQLGLVDRADPLVELVARKIIELGQQGERDPKRFRDLAVMAFTT